jgi:transcriptional regulator with XRE-family HTH domain
MLDSLKYFREVNNYSQSAVASYLGISRQMYIKYESGEVEPPLKVVVQLAKFYRVSYDMLIDNKRPGPKTVYEIPDSKPLEVDSPVPAYGSTSPDNSSYYLKTILDMLPRLIYSEQLKVLAMLSGMVQKQTEEKIIPDRKMQAYTKLLALNQELHLSSDGKKWTREELYER